jgi:hypothetical protein
VILTGGQFYGLVGITFTVARCMIQVKEFDKALKYSRSVITAVGALCLDSDILSAWTKAVTVYIKTSALALWSPKGGGEVNNKTVKKLWDMKSLLATGEDLRDVRKQVYSSKFEKEYVGECVLKNGLIGGIICWDGK